MLKRSALIFLLLGSLALSACSAVKFAYNNLDTVLLYWLDHYVDLTNEQEVWAKERIAASLQWHRQTQLPLYADMLAQQQERLTNRAYTQADALALSNTLRVHSATLLNYLVPDLVALATRLQPKQIQHLEERFKIDNKKFQKEYLSGEVNGLKNQAKKTISRIEWLFDNVDSEQAKQIELAVTQAQINQVAILAERIARQQTTLLLLRQAVYDKAPKERLERDLRESFLAMTALSLDAQRRLQLLENQQKSTQLTANTLKLLNPAQRQSGVTQLQEWEKDLRELATQVQK